ncbi:hypothetical protein VI06_00690 [Aquitalea magnusonii]|nr:hypothetical protein VI06_00690 [Aquitalea magnusonii]
MSYPAARQHGADSSNPIPNGSYMCPSQLTYFHDKLTCRLQQLQQDMHNSRQLLRHQGNCADPSDRASLEQDHTMEVKVHQQDSQYIITVMQALARIANGSYGWCELSGEEIGLARLNALPTATLTIEVQDRLEIHNRAYAATGSRN